MEVYILKKIEWEWQHILGVYATLYDVIKAQKIERDKIPLDDPNYDELIRCIEWEKFEVQGS